MILIILLLSLTLPVLAFTISECTRAERMLR